MNTAFRNSRKVVCITKNDIQYPLECHRTASDLGQSGAALLVTLDADCNENSAWLRKKEAKRKSLLS